MANVPSFRFDAGEHPNVPSSRFFWYRGTSECTLVPVFGTGEHPPKPPFGNHPLVNPNKKAKITTKCLHDINLRCALKHLLSVVLPHLPVVNKFLKVIENDWK